MHYHITYKLLVVIISLSCSSLTLSYADKIEVSHIRMRDAAEKHANIYKRDVVSTIVPNKTGNYICG